MFRRSGMKIWDKGHFQTPMRFSGVFTVEGADLDTLLRSLEPPSHKAWEPERGDDPAQSKQLLRNLSGWINDKFRDLIGVEDSAEIDAEGMSQFLPDDIDDAPTGTPEIKEKISEEPKEILAMRVRSAPMSTTPLFDPQEPGSGEDEDIESDNEFEPGGDEPVGPEPMPPIPHSTPTPGGGGSNGAKICQDQERPDLLCRSVRREVSPPI